jgi:secondary thiamine-phosphate synthase enzyme
MQIITTYLNISTQGKNHIIDITRYLQELLVDSGLIEGQLTVSAIGSTGGISTLEFEPGLVNRDVNEMFHEFAPYGKSYLHNRTWGDDNGASHLRSFLTGTSQTFLFESGKLILGTWQQIVFVDYDTRSRQRKIACQFMGR